MIKEKVYMVLPCRECGTVYKRTDKNFWDLNIYYGMVNGEVEYKPMLLCPPCTKKAVDALPTTNT